MVHLIVDNIIGDPITNSFPCQEKNEALPKMSSVGMAQQIAHNIIGNPIKNTILASSN